MQKLSLMNVNIFLQALLKKRVTIKATTLRSRSDDYKTELVNNFRRDCLPHFKVENDILL